MKILVTGARAPSCLELVRHFDRAGHAVHVTDSVKTGLARYSRSAREFHLLPGPRFHYAQFESALAKLIEEQGFELVVPTCEDIFFFAYAKKRLGLNIIFCDDFDKVARLHDKGRFAQDSLRWPIQCPESHLLVDSHDWKRLGLSAREMVLKPIHSRFATQTLISPSESEVEKIDFTKGPWIAQRRVYGDEICLYAVAQQGRLAAYSAYQPVHRAGVGAGIYFQPVVDSKLMEFCAHFAKDRSFHGQVAFDVIRSRDKSQYHLLECNPRATSGVHLFSEGELAAAFTGSAPALVYMNEDLRPMVALAMLIYGLRPFKSFRRDFKSGTDVIWRDGDFKPALGQFLFFGSLLARSVFGKKSAQALSSEDFEYNGGAIS